MTNKLLLGSATLLLIVIWFVTDPLTSSFHKNIFREWEEFSLEALFILLIGTVISSFVIFAIKGIFAIWFKKFFIWYFPVAYLLTFTFPTTGYTMIYRFDAAVILSIIMVVVTLGFVSRDKLKK